MKPRTWMIASLVGLAAVTFSRGQGTPNHAPPYDVKSEITLKGKVTTVAAIPDWMGKNGVNVTLQTPDDVIVHVDTAPEEFLRMLEFAIASGDDLEVTGVWGQWAGNRVLLARTLKRHRVAVTVRDSDGRPVW